MKDLIEQVLEIEQKAAAITQQAELDARKIVDTAHNEARDGVEKARAEAAAQMQQIIEQGISQAHFEHDRRLEEARRQSGKLVEVDPQAVQRAADLIVAAVLGRPQEA